ncbi:1-aminocyclopropane-1-carboxylate oxidase homolog 1-like [Silene latifolia]|uniref:1-aminocyclopropane-1-carboxylate oxidase homolog 1-like n=1 Tax=Silene latifolia TaxID=37657 RepID=UPI003D774233
MFNFIPITKPKQKLVNIKMSNQTSYDRTKDLKAFDERKNGVKGLLDETKTGEIHVPNIFVRPLEDRLKDLTTCHENITIPIIDLTHFNQDGYSKPEIVKEMLSASETWGFFQVVNHGIPMEVLDNMIEGTRMFHEQDNEVKKQFYSRDSSKVVTYNTNYDLYKSKVANWRDSLSVSTLKTGSFDPQELPSICREAILEFLKHIIKLGDLILELLSLALGLQPTHLGKLITSQAWTFLCHYYPSCPEPELTLGNSKHTDASFITLLLQDHIGGLQVLHDNQWVNVTPRPGALIVNVGDLLQIISNDKFKSVSHRVIAQTIGPRISIALFLRGLFTSTKKYGPIKELLSEENQQIYKDFTIEEFFNSFFSRPGYQSGRDYFKL